MREQNNLKVFLVVSFNAFLARLCPAVFVQSVRFVIHSASRPYKLVDTNNR